MTIKVLLFAQAKQLVGADSIAVKLPPEGDVESLLDSLVEAAPALSSMKSSLLVAVNNQFADRSQVICSTDTVACFPPVSGG